MKTELTELYIMRDQNHDRHTDERPDRLVESRQDLSAPRRVYVPPYLEIYGNIRELTLGGSPGTGDSGMANTNPQSGLSGQVNRHR